MKTLAFLLMAFTASLLSAVAPPIPVGLTATSISGTNVTLSWNASPGSVSYNIFRNNFFMKLVVSTNYIVTDLKTNGNYTFGIQATDAIGLRSPISKYITITTGSQDVPIGTAEVNAYLNSISRSAKDIAAYALSISKTVVSLNALVSTSENQVAELGYLLSVSKTVRDIFWKLTQGAKVNIQPEIYGGETTFHLASAASTNATVIKSSAGQVYSITIYNDHGSLARKLVFHNLTSTPIAGTNIFRTFSCASRQPAHFIFPQGFPLSNGIAITMVTGAADNNATAVVANELIINIGYK